MANFLLVKGRKVLVDSEDWDRLRRYKWTLMDSGNTTYCRRTTSDCNMIHREILGLTPKDDTVVDHINGNGLDNRRKNLRLVSRFENSRNLHHRKGEVDYHGVFKDGKRYRSMIRLKEKRKSIGNFRTPEAAALAYDITARHYFGDLASRINEHIFEKRPGLRGIYNKLIRLKVDLPTKIRILKKHE